MGIIKTKKGNVYGNRVVTGEVKVFWAAVDEPEQPGKFSKGGEYKVVFGIRKSTNYDSIKQAVLDTAKEAFGSNASFSTIYLPFQDGAKKKDETMADYVIVSAKSTRKPQVIDADGMTFAGPVYRGSTVKVSLVPMSYESPQVQHSRGITFKLGNVQVIESTAYSGPSAVEEFGVYQGSSEVKLEENDLPF